MLAAARGVLAVVRLTDRGHSPFLCHIQVDAARRHSGSVSRLSARITGPIRRHSMSHCWDSGSCNPLAWRMSGARSRVRTVIPLLNRAAGGISVSFGPARNRRRPRSGSPLAVAHGPRWPGAQALAGELADAQNRTRRLREVLQRRTADCGGGRHRNVAAHGGRDLGETSAAAELPSPSWTINDGE